ncbi:12338_t:CDS:2 [Funneliformis geosporum]|uniref:12338_t:CDS:1 n=1 Tax=Funneliformis geosporum TaxID=1117311 RepID=A0A9W4WLG9_9GLOM|nr:12338_t:CDS:2 [Funneliformis geosporum]
MTPMKIGGSEKSYGRHTRDTSISAASTYTAASTVNTQPYLPIAEKFHSPTKSFTSSSTYIEYPIEHVDVEAIWYRKYFIQNQHPTFVGITESYGTVIISLMLDGKTINNNRDNIYWYRYILRKKELPDDRGVLAGPPPSPLNDPPWDVLLRMISRELVQPRIKKLITTRELSEKLLALDEDRLQTTYKVGVLYCAPSQTTEEEWFSNTSTSRTFSDFLGILGKLVKLSEFEGFSGGLDTKSNETGEYSVYDDETLKNYEIMYHVSTMLPYETANKYQITRKRHIGNDIVCIIFQDVSKPFLPSSIRSQFLQVYVIVSPVEFQLDDDEYGWRTSNRVGYRVEIVCKDGVPYFGPSLPNPPIFYDPISLRQFLVAIIINGQNAAWKTPKLSEPFQRARGGIIQDIANKLVIFSNEVAPSPPHPPKKQSHVELNYILKRLFVDRLKFGGIPPDMAHVKELLEKGANPNISIPQPKPLKEKVYNNQVSYSLGECEHCNFCPTHSHSNSLLSSSSIKTTNNQKSHKLPNILFATIALADDPVYVKFLINYGVETMPKDSHFPNAFVFAATHKRVETMRCLLENVPALSDPESVDTAINDTYNRVYSRNTSRNGNKLYAAYAFKHYESSFWNTEATIFFGRLRGVS